MAVVSARGAAAFLAFFILSLTLARAEPLYVMSDQLGIFTLDADGNRTTIRAAGQMPSWTPDGRVIFCDQNQIWLMAADGSAAHPIPMIPLPVVLRPQLANGLIVFMGSRGPTGSPGAWLIREDGTGLRELVPGAQEPTIAPSGTWVALTIETPAPSEWPPYHRSVWRINTDGTGARQLTFPDDPASPDANAASISADEQSIAIFSGRDSAPGGDDLATRGWGNIAIIPATGGPRQLVTFCRPYWLDPAAPCVVADDPAWGNSGQIIYNQGALVPEKSGSYSVSLAGPHRLYPEQRGFGIVPMRR